MLYGVFVLLKFSTRRLDVGMDFHELLDIPQKYRRKHHDDVSVTIISLEGRICRSQV